MALTLERKKAIVADIAAIAQSALSGAAAEYAGLTAVQMSRLRAKARANQVTIRVVRNTLAIRAFENTSLSCMNQYLTGPLVLAFANEDPGAAARLFRDFLKENEKLAVRVIAVDGKAYPGSQLDAIAQLPTREQALSLLLSALQGPMSKLARTLVEPPAQLARVLAARRDQMEKAS